MITVDTFCFRAERSWHAFKRLKKSFRKKYFRLSINEVCTEAEKKTNATSVIKKAAEKTGKKDTHKENKYLRL